MPKTWRTPSASRAEATASPPVISMELLLLERAVRTGGSELDRHLQGAVGAVVGHPEGVLDLVDRQQVRQQRRHVDRAGRDQPDRVAEGLEPGLSLRPEGRVSGEAA